MQTWKAMLLLEEGRKVRRKSWKRKEDYIYLDRKGCIRHSNGNKYRLGNYIDRCDWEEYKNEEIKIKIENSIENYTIKEIQNILLRQLKYYIELD